MGGSVPTEYETLAAFSLIFWALTITVCIKYITIVLMASLNGMDYYMVSAAVAISCIG